MIGISNLKDEKNNYKLSKSKETMTHISSLDALSMMNVASSKILEKYSGKIKISNY